MARRLGNVSSAASIRWLEDRHLKTPLIETVIETVAIDGPVSHIRRLFQPRFVERAEVLFHLLLRE